MSEQAIKAFMSVASIHDVGRPENAAPALLARLSDAAISEARAILAVSEPVIYADGYSPAEYHGASDMRVSVLSRDYRGYAVASDALADSLRAFVGESL